MSDFHECWADECRQLVARDRLMCFRHWFKVPKPIRDEVWASYRQQPGSDRHWAAITAARESLRS